MRSTCVTSACSVRGSRAGALCDAPLPSRPPATWASADVDSLTAAGALATPAVFPGLQASVVLMRESGDERLTFGCSGRLSGCDAGEAGTRDEAGGANGEADSALLHAAASSSGVVGREQLSGPSDFVDFVESVVVVLVLVLGLGLLGSKNGTANAYDEAAVSSPRPLSTPVTRCSSGTWPMSATKGLVALSSMLASGVASVSGRLSISN